MTPTKEDRLKAREVCVGSVHGEIGAIPCNCAAVAQALSEARMDGAAHALKSAMRILKP